MGNSAAPIPAIPDGVVSHGDSPTSPHPKWGHRTPGTLIRFSPGELESGVESLLTTENSWLGIISSQPACGFLCPRLPELPWPRASQVWLFYAKDTGCFLSPHLSLPQSASRTCRQSRCVSSTVYWPFFPSALSVLWFYLQTCSHFPHPKNLYVPNPSSPIWLCSRGRVYTHHLHFRGNENIVFTLPGADVFPALYLSVN